MAMNLSPSHWIEGYSATASAVTIPLSALPGLDASEADASDGDIRKVARAFMAALYDAWLAEPAADRPAKMALSRSTNVNDSTGATFRSYQAQFQVVTTGEDVAAEDAGGED